MAVLTQIDFFFGVLTPEHFHKNIFVYQGVGIFLAMAVVTFGPALLRRWKDFCANQKIKEQEFLAQRRKTVSELHRLEEIGALYTNFLAGGSKWSGEYENSSLGKASLNEIRAGLLLDVRKTMDRSELTPGNRKELLKALKRAWDSISFFGILKSGGKNTEIDDDMPIIDAQNILEAFIALCEPSLKFGGPDWEAVYQKIVVPLLDLPKQG